jgi:hypothetical protein
MTWLKILKNGSNYYVSSNTILLEELTCMSIAILTLTRKEKQNLTFAQH